MLGVKPGPDEWKEWAVPFRDYLFPEAAMLEENRMPEVKAPEITVGSLVRLKSGGPIMTVVNFATMVQGKGAVDGFKCLYSDDSDRIRSTGWLMADALHLVLHGSESEDPKD